MELDPLTTTASFSLLIKHGIIAFFGAIVHAASAHRKGLSKGILDFVLLTIMSSFSGAMFAFIAIAFYPEQIYLTLALAGSGGFLGVEGMTLVIERVKYMITGTK